MRLLCLHEISEAAGATSPAFDRAFMIGHDVSAPRALSVLEFDCAFLRVNLVEAAQPTLRFLLGAHFV